ncbi:MAG: hypothetical protein ABJD24_11095 [Acidimicrobiales bacterium]
MSAGTVVVVVGANVVEAVEVVDVVDVVVGSVTTALVSVVGIGSIVDEVDVGPAALGAEHAETRRVSAAMPTADQRNWIIFCSCSSAHSVRPAGRH